MTLNAAEIIAAGLADAGCRHVFGMPGGEVLVLLDALERAGVAFTLCKHENNAGYMAEGSWQATGAPGVLLTTIGPGLANGINSIANAYQEQVPLIVLSGCIGDAQSEQFTHQVIDQSALLASITKAQFRVAPGTAGHVVSKAISLALADPPGPVHIDLPDTIAASDCEPVKISARVWERGNWPDGPGRRAAIAKLATAKRPLVLAGIGAVLHKASAVLTELAVANNIPVLTTYKAKGIFDEGHALSLGGHGLSPLSDDSILPLLRASDCVILAGYDPIEMRAGWIQPWAAENAIEIIHAQIEHGMHGSEIRFVGDVADSLSALAGGLAEPLKNIWPDAAPARAKQRLSADFQCREDWGPHRVFEVLRSCAPKHMVATVDSGAHRILMSQMWRCQSPGELLQSSAFCTMGISLPLAMGYKFANPKIPVVSVLGDAGLDMVAGELATLRDMRFALPIVVLVDDSLALIEKKQTAMQLPQRGVGFEPTDFVAVAKAYGGHGESIKNADQLQDALGRAFDADRFTILACKIDKASYRGAF